MTEPFYIEAGATFDDSRAYRYTLVRRWAPGPTVLWIMLNPSTADEVKLDPTLQRCLSFTMNYSRMWQTLFGEQYGAFEICNLYALRSTDPKKLWTVDDPVGPGNDDAIVCAAKRASLVICGWGTNAKPERERKVAQLLADAGVQPYALRVCKNGSPSHPLYLPSSLLPRPWHAKGLRAS